MKRGTEERSDALVLLDCEVCHEETVLLVPSRRADHGIVDCPHCRTTYVVSLVPREEREPTVFASPPQATA
jgi:hypothetical protein